MVSSAITPSRLVLARERRGFTKAALGAAIGVSAKTVSAYEKGLQEPHPRHLRALISALEFPAEFFIGIELPPAPIEAASFRALKNLTAKQRLQAAGSATIALAVSRWIEARFQLPTSTVPQLRYYADAEAAAELVRRDWGVGERPIGNMVHLLEAHGVRVFSLVEECAEMDAFSLWIEGVPYIFLNTMKSAEHSRMDAAHELGHLAMHFGHETPRGREREREAQTFGAAFLMPRGSVLAYAPRRAYFTDLNRAKHQWKVSLANLVYRMRTLGLLTDWEFRNAFIELSARGYRRSEPDGVPRETSLVFAKVFEALKREDASKVDIAHDLAIPIDEVNAVVFGLTLTPLRGSGPDRPVGAIDSSRPALRVV
jgi:Zn-dependent peptidase ImmA (M78 family)/transcriptional regulator with XRE-family HTH domain